MNLWLFVAAAALAPLLMAAIWVYANFFEKTAGERLQTPNRTVRVAKKGNAESISHRRQAPTRLRDALDQSNTRSSAEADMFKVSSTLAWLETVQKRVPVQGSMFRYLVVPRNVPEGSEFERKIRALIVDMREATGGPAARGQSHIPPKWWAEVSTPEGEFQG